MPDIFNSAAAVEMGQGKLLGFRISSLCHVQDQAADDKYLLLLCDAVWRFPFESLWFRAPNRKSRILQEERALGAAVPALGLSNKAVYSSDEVAERDGPDLAPRAEPGAVSGRPLEEHLQQSTLWPEVYKAYGHGNELYCMAADPRGALLASACKAQVLSATQDCCLNPGNLGLNYCREDTISGS